MTPDEAQKTLNLSPGFSAADLEQTSQQQIAEAQAKRERAPTPQLRSKFTALIERLEEARHLLLLAQGQKAAQGRGATSPSLSQTQMADLPRAQATGGDSRAGFGTQPGGAGASEAAALRPGQMLAGRYEIRQLIGTGGMGAVYRAFDRNRDKDIAIKVLLPHLLNHSKAVERFVQEARLSSEMSHPHIVNVFDVQQEPGFCFLTMELLEGQTLRQLLQAKAAVKRTFGVDEAVAIATQVADALAYAHEKMVHRDIKPENIWITEQGKAKVMDFGIARLLNNTQDAKTQLGVGTAYYMAPEQLIGTGQIDGRADQYALGVMLYEMLAGHVPMGRIESLRVEHKTVPRSISDAVDTALSSRQDKRFANMEAFRDALLQRKTSRASSDKPWFMNTKLHIAAGVVVLAVAAPPAWQYFSHSQQLKQNYGLLDGQTHALQKQVEEKLRELEGDVSALEREKDKLEGELRQAANAESSARIEEIRKQLPLQRNILDHYKQALNAEDGLMEVEGNLKSAEESRRGNDYGRATDALMQSRKTLQRLIALPQLEREQEAARERAAAEATEKAKAEADLLAAFSAKWSLGPCSNSESLGVVHFDENKFLLVGWNGDPDMRETLTALNPAERSIDTKDAAGVPFRYQLISKNQMDAHNLKTNEHTALNRCS